LIISIQEDDEIPNEKTIKFIVTDTGIGLTQGQIDLFREKSAKFSNMLLDSDERTAKMGLPLS